MLVSRSQICLSLPVEIHPTNLLSIAAVAVEVNIRGRRRVGGHVGDSLGRYD